MDRAQIDRAVFVTSTRFSPVCVHAVLWNLRALVELARPPHLRPLVNRSSQAEGFGETASELAAVAGVVVAAFTHAICCVFRFALFFGDIAGRITPLLDEVVNCIVTVSEDLLRISERTSQRKQTNVV